MANQVLQGSLLAITLDNERIQCEIDSTLNISTETTEGDPCKPLSTEAYQSAKWTDAAVDRSSWSLDLSAKAFAEVLQMNNLDILDKIVNGSLIVEVEFKTTQTTDYDYDQIAVFSGTGILTDFTWNAPSAGESTYDLTITGKGKPTFTRTNVTT